MKFPAVFPIPGNILADQFEAQISWQVEGLIATSYATHNNVP
jgi:hypothetical protein